MEDYKRIGDSERKAGEAGALLIEILIGTVTIMIALTAVMSVVLSSAVMRQQNAELTLAYSAASNALEELRTLPIDELLARDASNFACPALNGTEDGLLPVDGDVDGMPGEITVVLDSSGSGSNVYHVVALVRWAGVNGSQTLQLETLIGERTSL